MDTMECTFQYSDNVNNTMSKYPNTQIHSYSYDIPPIPSEYWISYPHRFPRNQITNQS